MGATRHRLSAIERDRICEQRRPSRHITELEVLKITRLPRSLMNPEDLKVTYNKARKAQIKKRTGLTEEQRQAECQKGKEHRCQRRSTMSEEE